MNTMKQGNNSELIINKDGSVYHLRLRPDQIAGTVLMVGDPGRVTMISRYFDKVEHEVCNREFLTHTGFFKNKRITVLSTGIGTDNIDIVINELDAAVNIDLDRRIPKERHTALNIIRLGTSGALQSDIPVGTFAACSFALGFDGLLYFYKHDESLTETAMTDAFVRHTSWSDKLARPYIVAASDMLLDKIATGMVQGITATANGFYGPQGRELRIPLAFPDLNRRFESFRYKGCSILNYEMESSALYALGKILGHQTLTVCDIIANRKRKEFNSAYGESLDQMIRLVLDRVANIE